MSLRTRLGVLVAVTVLVASTIGGLGVALTSRSVGRDRLDQQLQADIAEIDPENPRLAVQLQVMLEIRRTTCTDEVADETADDSVDEALVDTGPRAARGPLDRLDRLRPFVEQFSSSMQVIRSNGSIVAGCQALPIDPSDSEIAAAESGSDIRTVSIDGRRYRLLTTGYPGVGAVQVARDMELTDSTLRGLFVRIVGFGAVGALLAGLVGWAFARRATDPIERLNEAANRIAATRDLGERIDVDGTDEVQELATSFNMMLSSLDTSREQQRRLVQDASHELRTPLTSMRTNVELLQRHRNVDPELRERVLEDIAAELGELTELTSELVDSATEIPHDLVQASVFDLAEVVEDCVERAERRHRRTITLEQTEGGPTAVHGDPSLVARAVTNLLNNAAKFCEAPGAITITRRGTAVTVTDEGPGIPEGDLPHVFERFYRATTARSAPGSGLGLAIVRQIVAGHGGSVHVQNRSTGGLEIGFSLPAAAASGPDAQPSAAHTPTIEF